MRGHRAAPDGSRADSVCFSILAHEWAGVELGLLARISGPRIVPVLGPVGQAGPVGVVADLAPVVAL